jgi:toxin-antitoxin system PIN domain toxin
LSYSLDANVLIYASDASSPHHDAARRFLDECVASDEILYLAWPILMAYLRIATHPRVFEAPLSHDEALRNVENLCALPQVQVLSEGPDFLAIYREVTGVHPIRGNLVPDAHLACLLRSNGVRTLYTLDRGFRRFEFLRVKLPWS